MACKPEEHKMTLGTQGALIAKIRTAVIGETYLFLFRKKPQQRTKKQNDYYHAEHVEKFTDWLEEEWGGDGLPATRGAREKYAHELLKANCGWDEDMVIGSVRMNDAFSTTRLDRGGMARYEDRCAMFLQNLTPPVYVETPQQWRERNGIPEPEADHA